nr:MAG TPA: hypothetical protein [Caudoviricetes sp.]
MVFIASSRVPLWSRYRIFMFIPPVSLHQWPQRGEHVFRVEHHGRRILDVAPAGVQHVPDEQGDDKEHLPHRYRPPPDEVFVQGRVDAGGHHVAERAAACLGHVLAYEAEGRVGRGRIGAVRGRRGEAAERIDARAEKRENGDDVLKRRPGGLAGEDAADGAHGDAGAVGDLLMGHVLLFLEEIQFGAQIHIHSTFLMRNRQKSGCKHVVIGKSCKENMKQMVTGLAHGRCTSYAGYSHQGCT